VDKLTFYIAVYGAGLATLVFLWDIVKYNRDKTKLRVEANLHALVGPKSEIKIGIDMINDGRRPLTIVASGFKLDTDAPNVATAYDINLPIELNEGQKHTSFVNPNSVDITKVRYAWARDATGREYHSKKRPLKGWPSLQNGA
jgi:hypothetical protein